MATSCIPPGLDIALLTGPMLLGYMFSYGLLGILVVQMFLYHISFPSDAPWMKTTVWSMFFFECITTLFATISAWDLLGSGWGNLTALTTLPWAFDPLPPLSGFLASMVHFFFCWRIYKLTSIVTLPILIACISLVQWVMTFYISIKVGSAGGQVSELEKLTSEVIVWLVGSALADVIITVSMVTILLRATSKSSFSQTSSVLMTLIKFTVETGMTTSFGAVLEVILFLVYRTNNLHFILFLMLSKLYSNTLLATLNSRVILKPGGLATQKSSIQSSGGGGGTAMWEDANGTRSRVAAPRVGPKDIRITTRTEMMNDDLELVVVKKDDDGEFYRSNKVFDGGESGIPADARRYDSSRRF